MKKLKIAFVVLLATFCLITAVPSRVNAASDLLKDVGVKITNDNEIKEKSLNLADIKDTNMKKWSDCFTSVSYQSLYSDACVIDPNQPKYVYYNNAITINGVKYDLKIEVNRTTPKINLENTMVLDSGTWPREYLNVAALGTPSNLTRLYAQNDGGSNDSKFDVTITFYKNGEKAKIKNSLIGFRDPDYASYYFDTNRQIYYKTAPNTSGASSIEDVYHVTPNGLIRYDRMSQDGFSSWQDALFAVEIKNEDSFTFTLEGQSDLLILPTFYTIERKFNINYANLNGAENTNPNDYISGNEITIKNPGNRTGYEFEGWEEGNKIEVDDFGDKTFTAKWRAAQYTIKYNGNGAENEMESQVFSFEDPEFMSKENEFIYPHHNFLGFSLIGIENLITTPTDFRDILVGMGSGAEITLVAQWEARPFTQFVDIDTGAELLPEEDGQIQPKDIENYVYIETEADTDDNWIHKYKAVKTNYVDEEGAVLLEPKPGKQAPEDIPGYKLIKTEDNPKGDRTHIYHKVITSWVDESGKALHPSEDGTLDPKVFPNYKLVKSEVKENGDTVHTYHHIQTSWVDEKNVPIVESKVGDYPKEDFPNYEFVRTETKPNGDVVHHYHKLVNLKFVVDGKAVKEDKIKRGADGVAPEVTPKNGYKFIGWDKEFKNIQVDTVVTAKLEPIKYPITYVLDGGKNDDANPSSYTVEDAVTLKNPIKLGAKFLGWKEGNAIAKGSTGAKTFTAQWEIVTAPVNTGAGERVILVAVISAIAIGSLVGALAVKKKKED